MGSDKIENLIGQRQWRRWAKEKKRKIVSPTSPESVRVPAILRDIVQAMHAGLGLQHDCHVSVYVPKSTSDYSIPNAIGSLIFDRKKAMGSHSLPQGALLVSGLGDQKRQVSTSRVDAKGECDDSSKTRKNPRKLGLKCGTEHLERMNWEVMVVDPSKPKALYLPNGKIVFFTGYLKRTDADIATVLAHEVGHSVGRHRKEMEADYIGMMLMAAAGYDPRTAPKLLRYTDSCVEYSRSYKPFGRRRKKNLNQEEVMDKAVEIYVQSRVDQGLK